MVSKSKRTKDSLKETQFEFFLQININQHFAKQNCKLLTAASLRKNSSKTHHTRTVTPAHTEVKSEGGNEREREITREREGGRGRESTISRARLRTNLQ
jgi:hypothetical protein